MRLEPRDRLREALRFGLYLSVVAVALLACVEQARLNDRVDRIDRVWSGRLARYERIRGLAFAISAPSNEVFDSGNLAAESSRSRLARAEFTAQMDSARLELAGAGRSASSPTIVADVEGVKSAVDPMLVDVDHTFASYEVNPPPDVAVMNGHLGRVSDAIDLLEHDAREAQGFETRRCLSSASAFNWALATMLALLSVCLVLTLLILRRGSASAADLSEHPDAPVAESRRGGLVDGILVGLFLSTLILSMSASQRQDSGAAEILRKHRAGSERLARYDRVGRLVTAMSDPCNEVFDSGDLASESARSRQARVALAAELDSAQVDLARLPRGDASALAFADLDGVKTAIDTTMSDVDRTFASFGVARPPDVVVIDRHLARAQAALDRLERSTRSAQAREAATILSAPIFSRRMALAILLLFPAPMIVVRLIERRRARASQAVTEAEEPEPARVAPRPEAAPSTLILDAPDPVITIGVNGRILGWNPHAEKMFGLSPAVTPGARFSETVIAPGHRDGFDQILFRFVQDGDEEDLNRRLEITALDHAGREFPIELAVVPTRTADATVLNVFLRDVTERRHADDQLRRLTLVASKTASGVVITNAAGRVEWINDAFERMTGYALAELRGQDATALWRRANTDPGAIEHVVEGIRSGSEFHVELASETRDGRAYWVEIEATPVFDDGGTLAQLIAIVTNVSERKRAESALRESEAKTRVVVEESPDAIITVDDAGVIQSVNPASERIFGYRPGELIGMHVRALMQSSAGNGDAGVVEAGEGPWPVSGGTHELIGRRRNGSIFPIEITTGEKRLEGVRTWTGSVRDITGRKQAEALRAGQNRVLELLASGAPLARSLTELIRLVEEQQPGTVCMILILDPATARLRNGGASHLPDDLVRAVEEIGVGPAACTWGTAVHQRKRVIVEDTATHPSWSRHRPLALFHGLRSSWAEPILSTTGLALGAFVVFRRRVHSPIASELELVTSAAHIASIAIERTRAIEAMNVYRTTMDETVDPTIGDFRDAA
jgi:PAS domain S-box-containing protein